MPPELILLTITALCLALGYGWLFPAILEAQPPRPLRRIIEVDIALTAAALTIGSLLYSGEGRGFSLFIVTLPWWGFLIITYVTLELLLWNWFSRRHGITFDDF